MTDPADTAATVLAMSHGGIHRRANGKRMLLPDMARPPQGSPIGEAMVWVSRITAIGLVMFLPGVAGGWLDTRLGTSCFGLAGLVLGFSAAITWLVQLQRRKHR